MSDQDNIAESTEIITQDGHVVPIGPAAATQSTEEINLDVYTERFDKLADMSDVISDIVDGFNNAKHNDDRMTTLMAFAKTSAKMNQELVTLLIEMNNLFGKS